MGVYQKYKGDWTQNQYNTLIEWKKETYMILSINAENGFDKIEHPFIIKSFRKLERGKVP